MEELTKYLGVKLRLALTFKAYDVLTNTGRKLFEEKGGEKCILERRDSKYKKRQ